MTPGRSAVRVVRGSSDIIRANEHMKVFGAFEFSSDFVGKGEFYFVIVVEVDPFYDVLIVFFVEDPGEEH